MIDFWKVYTDVGGGNGHIIYALLFVTFTNNLPEQVFIAYNLSFICFINGLVKTFVADPRPFWDYDSVQTFNKCSLEFGNPSGHAFCALFFCIYLYYYWCH
jgi:membrane-associated phospholipid phosphatase